jgi:hypothetical protein
MRSPEFGDRVRLCGRTSEGSVVKVLAKGTITIGVLWDCRDRPSYYSPDQLEVDW